MHTDRVPAAPRRRRRTIGAVGLESSAAVAPLSPSIATAPSPPLPATSTSAALDAPPTPLGAPAPVPPPAALPADQDSPPRPHRTALPHRPEPASRPSRSRRHPRTGRLKGVLVCADAAAAVTAMSVAAALDRWWFQEGIDRLALVAAASVPLWPILFAQQGLYQARRLSRRMEELRRIVNASLTGLLVLAGLSVLVESTSTRSWLALVFVCVTVLVYGEREVVRRVLTARRSRGQMKRRVVVVGRNAEAVELSTMLQDHPQHGYEVVGFVADPAAAVVDLRTGGPFAPYLGTVQDVLDLCRSTEASGVIVATTSTDLDSANRLIRELTREGLFVEMTSAMRDISPSRISLRSLGPYPLLAVEPVAELSWRRVAKRAFDLTVASMMLLVALPVLVVSAAAIRLSSGPGVLFRQRRVGRGGKVFTVLKLRTMVVGAEARLSELLDRNEAAGPMFKMADDPRVTRVGRVLRRTSIDELPQLLNVLRGDMSLVGPRPALPGEAEAWGDELRERLRVKPGITGEWQISGRFRASMEDYERLDLHYVDNWSLVRDLVILLKTVPAVLRRDGAA